MFMLSYVLEAPRVEAASLNGMKIELMIFALFSISVEYSYSAVESSRIASGSISEFAAQSSEAATSDIRSKYEDVKPIR